MKTKLFYGNQHIKNITVDGRRYTFLQKMDMFMFKWIKRLAIFMFVLGVATGSLKVGQATTAPKLVKADTIVKEIPTMPNIPVLARIAKCESGGSQFDKNGQVIMHANTNNTIDAGKYQINITMWGKRANAMGLNLMVEKDNEAFAQWLYLNQGTSPWSASQKCWQ